VVDFAEDSEDVAVAAARGEIVVVIAGDAAEADAVDVEPRRKRNGFLSLN